MARLTIQNVPAPNLSGVSEILANSGKNLNQGLSAVSKTLTDYETGQKETTALALQAEKDADDNAVMNELAAITTKEDLASWFAKGGARSKNNSSTVQKYILDRGKGITDLRKLEADIKHVDATTESEHGRLAIAQANSQRAGVTHQQGVTKFNQEQVAYKKDLEQQEILNKLTPLRLANIAESERLGNNYSGQPTPARDALNTALSTSGLDNDKITSFLGGMTSSRKTGQTLVDQTNKFQNQEAGNELALEVLSDVDIVNSKSAVTSAQKLVDKSVSATSQIARIKQVDEISKNPVFADLLNSNSTGVPEEESLAKSDYMTRVNIDLQANPKTQYFKERDAVNESKTSGEWVRQTLNLDNDPETSGAFMNWVSLGLLGEAPDAELNVQNYIRKAAKKIGASEATVAVALTRNFKRDPSGSNTTDRRFGGLTDLKKWVDANMNKEIEANYSQKIDKIKADNKTISLLQVKAEETRSIVVKDIKKNGKSTKSRIDAAKTAAKKLMDKIKSSTPNLSDRRKAFDTSDLREGSSSPNIDIPSIPSSQPVPTSNLSVSELLNASYGNQNQTPNFQLINPLNK